MNKRDAVLGLLNPTGPQTYISAAFFLHFPAPYHAGQAAADKHLEYFRATGMDFVKIQYEAGFPPLPFIQRPDDWAKTPPYDRAFFDGQLKAVEALVKAAKGEALIIQTLYSTFMCAGHSTSDALLTEHLRQDPDKVKKGLEIITDSLLGFVRECIKLGVDGFYTSTQGGEAGRFDDPAIFTQYVKPYDLVLMNEANRSCPFNILHVCDYQRDYDTFAPFVDYPGSIVNSPLQVGGKPISPKDVSRLFHRPYMGGMERKGTLATGTPAQVRAEAESILREAPDRFLLAADCTVPAETPWENLKAAIDAAHAFRRG